MANQPEPIVKPIMLASTRAADYKNMYVNATKMGVSPWDIRVTVGQVIENADGTNVTEEQITLLMSPQHAKVVLQSLQTTIEVYERTFGEIKDLKDFTRGALALREQANLEKPKNPKSRARKA
jgi:hypothetical protein